MLLVLSDPFIIMITKLEPQMGFRARKLIDLILLWILCDISLFFDSLMLITSLLQLSKWFTTMITVHFTIFVDVQYHPDKHITCLPCFFLGAFVCQVNLKYRFRGLEMSIPMIENIILQDCIYMHICIFMHILLECIFLNGEGSFINPLKVKLNFQSTI
jgi:hypothetical protein